MYKNTIARYQTELEKEKIKLKNEGLKGRHFRQISEGSLNLMSNPLKHYQNLDIEAKQNLLRIFFPENIKFSDSKCRTPRLNSVILQMLLIDKELEAGKSEKISEFLLHPTGVELRGIEPLSSQVNRRPSTCLATYLNSSSKRLSNPPKN